jgi:hypothetical protein
VRVQLVIDTSERYLSRNAWWAIPVIGYSRLQSGRFGADDAGMSSCKEPVCETCGQPVDPTTVVVIPTGAGDTIVRHRRCHMLELLERA